MAGKLPGVRELRLHPDDRAELGNGGGGQAEASALGAVAEEDESTVSFKDLATLVAVVLDRKDAIDRAGSRLCARNHRASGEVYVHTHALQEPSRRSVSAFPNVPELVCLHCNFPCVFLCFPAPDWMCSTDTCVCLCALVGTA